MNSYPEAVAKIANDYLERVKSQLRLVPLREQNEFLAEIESHVYEAYQQTPGDDDIARILAVLRNLGEPAEVVYDRLPRTMARSGAKRNVPLYVIGGIFIALFGIPLGFGGLGVMIGILAKLHFATADAMYRDRCNALIQSFSGEVSRAYISMGSYLNGLEVAITGLQIIIIGQKDNPKTHELANAVIGRSLPNRFMMIVDPDEQLPLGHPAEGKTMQNGQPTAYVCQRQTCSAPITNPVTLSQVLQLPPRVQGQA